jgi:hypothetical protein
MPLTPEQFEARCAAAEDGRKVADAIKHLRIARDLLKAANAPRALARVKLALSSAKGAERNAGYRQSREAR